MSFSLMFLFYIIIIVFEKYHLFVKNERHNFESKRKLDNIYQPIRIIVDENCLYSEFLNANALDDYKLTT